MTKQDTRSIQEIWKLFRETDKEIKETSRVVKETSRKVDALTGKWGRFVEGLIAPAVKDLFKAWDITLDRVFQRVKVHKNGKSMEIDIMAINQEYAVLIEAKSTLGLEDIREHLKTLKEFKEYFPEYKDKKVLGCVAGIVIDEGADKYAYREGLFVIGQSGETVSILNDKSFKPKMW